MIDIALVVEFQNHGVGKYLLKTILDKAAETATPVNLHVQHLNPAYRLYERLGFKDVEDRGLQL